MAEKGVKSILLPNATGFVFNRVLSSVPKTKAHLNLGRVIQNIEVGVTKTCTQLSVYTLRSSVDLFNFSKPKFPFVKWN